MRIVHRLATWRVLNEDCAQVGNLEDAAWAVFTAEWIVCELGA